MHGSRVHDVRISDNDPEETHVGAMRIQIVYKHRIWSQTDKTIPFFPDSICDMYS